MTEQHRLGYRQECVHEYVQLLKNEGIDFSGKGYICVSSFLNKYVYITSNEPFTPPGESISVRKTVYRKLHPQDGARLRHPTVLGHQYRGAPEEALCVPHLSRRYVTISGTGQYIWHACSTFSRLCNTISCTTVIDLALHIIGPGEAHAVPHPTTTMYDPLAAGHVCVGLSFVPVLSLHLTSHSSSSACRPDASLTNLLMHRNNEGG